MLDIASGEMLLGGEFDCASSTFMIQPFILTKRLIRGDLLLTNRLLITQWSLPILFLRLAEPDTNGIVEELVFATLKTSAYFAANDVAA